MQCEIYGCLNTTSPDNMICHWHRQALPPDEAWHLRQAIKAYLDNPMQRRNFTKYRQRLAIAQAALNAQAQARAVSA